MSSLTEPLKQQTERHTEYYLSGGDLYLLVDNVVFRVHAYFFERDSIRFKAMLSAPVPPNQTRPGSSDSKPIIIKNSSPSAFAKFLWVFYNTTYSDYTATVAEWTCILKTACEYEFVEVQHCAIRGLQTCELTTIERIHIYELYKANPKYIVPLYVKMAMRDEAPTDAEVDHLGAKSALAIFRIREYLRARPGASDASPLPAGVDEEDVLDGVCLFLGHDRAKLQIPASSSQRRTKNPNGASGGQKGSKNGSNAFP